MPFKKPDYKYWDHKFAAYLHDPFDKAFDIKGHEERAAQLLEIFGLDLPNEKHWIKADGIASGFERGQVPSYSADENKNGAVNFINSNEAVITHPIGEEAKLRIDLSHINVHKLHEDIKHYLKNEIGVKAGQSGYSRHFPDDDEGFAQARLLYAHLALRFKLSKDNVGGLGALWHRLPADTRFPDHSIWQHNALTSALTSCMELAGDEDAIGLMVFSITPVQGFIANARKLRDFWTGSVFLSWLAFEGLRWVIESLGPDHVLYPSLVDQPLVNEYLITRWRIDKDIFTEVRDIASLPNKFVLLIPLNKADDIGKAIQNAIHQAWRNLIENVERHLASLAPLHSPPEFAHLSKMIREQTEMYWDLHWAAVKLAGENDSHELTDLLPKAAYSNQMNLLKILNKIIAGKNYQTSGKGTLYSVSHHLAQSALAAQKMRRLNKRPPQNGEKCAMCGEFEALHGQAHQEGQSAANYKKHIKEFWSAVSKNTGSESEIRENERFCAICYAKRMGYRVIKEKLPDHILSATFKEANSFPSTTGLAISDLCRRVNIPGKKCEQLAQKIHELNDEKEANKIISEMVKEAYKNGGSEKTVIKFSNSDKYYAILLMDGDNMGKLINGETVAANWKSIMHPVILKRLQNANFDALYRENWETIFEKYSKRSVTPSIHAAISEALADFSIYGVKPIIDRYDGRLIYAGGDDVCAVLPWQTAIQAAREIRDFYISQYKLITTDDNNNTKETKVHDIDAKKIFGTEQGKLSVLLGEGENISISAAVVIAHYKDNLSHLIRRAHNLLAEKAKREMGRDALAIELKKRSGGSRYLAAKWDADLWQNFEAVLSSRAKEFKEISNSLLYRLSALESGIIALKDQNDDTRLVNFIKSMLEKSDSSKERANTTQLAKNIKNLLLVQKDDNNQKHLATDGLIIASFLAQKEAE